MQLLHRSQDIINTFNLNDYVYLIVNEIINEKIPDSSSLFAERSRTES